MHSLWERLLRASSHLAPSLPHGGLRTPVTAAQLAHAERVMRCELPPDVRSAYLTFNGMERKTAPWLGGTFHWLPLQEVVSSWVDLQCVDWDPLRRNPGKPSPGMRAFHCCTDPGWIPLGSDNTGGLLLTDLHPTRWGQHGQLLTYHFEDGHPHWVAPSLQDSIRALLDGLEAGHVSYRPDYCAFMTTVGDEEATWDTLQTLRKGSVT
jgi:cell wall assembly regulator SMI1